MNSGVIFLVMDHRTQNKMSLTTLKYSGCIKKKLYSSTPYKSYYNMEAVIKIFWLYANIQMRYYSLLSFREFLIKKNSYLSKFILQQANNQFRNSTIFLMYSYLKEWFIIKLILLFKVPLLFFDHIFFSNITANKFCYRKVGIFY